MDRLRQIDALIAEHVFGETVVERRWGKDNKFIGYSIGEPSWDDFQGEMILANPLPAYTQDIAAAWSVLEKFGVFRVGTTTVGNLATEMYFAEVFKNEFYNGLADTAPRAICLAALKALNVEVPE